MGQSGILSSVTDSLRARAVAPVVLLVAVLAISTSAPIVRVVGTAPLVIATWRVGLSVLVVSALALITGGWREWRLLRGADWALAVAAGVALAVHFWSWIASIGLTSVAASVVLVNLQPVVVAAGSTLWLSEGPSRRQWAGVMVAVMGAGLVGLADAPAAPGRNPLLGNALALLGAVTAALYYLAGRRLRAVLGLWPYTTVVYGTCFVVLLTCSVALGEPLLDVTPEQFGWYAALAAGPMLLGHTGMNWALKHLPAYVVNLTVLGEPVGATLLAWMIPTIGEPPTATVVCGGAAVLAGAVFAATGRKRG